MSENTIDRLVRGLAIATGRTPQMVRLAEGITDTDRDAPAEESKP